MSANYWTSSGGGSGVRTAGSSMEENEFFPSSEWELISYHNNKDLETTCVKSRVLLHHFCPGGPLSSSSSYQNETFGMGTTTLEEGSSEVEGGSGGAVSRDREEADETLYSISPVETPELVYGRWEDEVIWSVEQVIDVPEEPTILTLDDENIVVSDDVDPKTEQRAVLDKAGVTNAIEEDSLPRWLRRNDDKDPYNISSDEFYFPKFSKQSLPKTIASGNIRHSTPVVELRAPFIPTCMSQTMLRAFHRPAMKRYSSGSGRLSHPGPHAVYSLSRNIKKKAKQREQELLAAGGGEIFFMKSPDDVTGKDGELILIEYCEEYPPLLSQVGMCSRIRNYYKRQADKDKGLPELPYGEVVFAHTTPFLGTMQAGSCIQALENLLYRAPIFQHPIIKSDFLVIRTRQNYFIREIDALFAAGQECPLFEVPRPHSKRATDFVRNFLQVFIYRLFWKSKDNPRRIRMEEIKRAFPTLSGNVIRMRLKLCADCKQSGAGADSSWWVIKPDFRLPTEEEIRSMVSPEQCCAYFSIIAGEQRLKDAGYGEKFLFAPPPEDDEDDNQNKIDDEVKAAPWNTTRAYIQSMQNKCLLQLTGPADPTGCGEAFSYIRVPNKPQANKEEQEPLPKRSITGTDADLRRLTQKNAKAILRKFAVPEEEMKKLSRWEVIDAVRTLSTEKAKAGEKGMKKFSRRSRSGHKERYKEESQRIFELQNRVLANSEVLSTDDDSSDSELSDIEEMGKDIEDIISYKKTTFQINLKKEEQERRELRKMMLGESKDDDDKSLKKKRKEEEANQTLSGLVNHPGRVLKIQRTYRTPDGKEFTRTEAVRNAAIIDIYMRIRTTKGEPFIKKFALSGKQAKEEIKKEKQRIREQLKQMKKNQEKETTKSTPAPRKRKTNPDLKIKCGACGQVGHMKRNKACPLYNASSLSLPSLDVSMSQEDGVLDNKLVPDEDELVRVEGTKVQISGKLKNMYTEDIKRPPLVLRIPKAVLQMQNPGIRRTKRKAASSPHCDYLTKKKQKTHRRRIDPIVVISGIFESVLKELRDHPDSGSFHFPVDFKTFPDYTQRVSTPMDLQTIRENIRQKKYQLTSAFLSDVAQIYDNSVVFNTSKSLISEYALSMLNLCKQRLKDKANELEKLERLINPLLDNDQIALSHILNQCLAKLKSSPEAVPFLTPVDRKKVKNYYEKITKPMDLSRIEEKNKGKVYKSRQDFLSDVDQIGTNSKLYNGMDSSYTHQSAQLMNIANDFLTQFNDQILVFEANIEKSKSNTDKKFTTFEEPSREAELSENDENMEAVDVPGADDYVQSASAAAVSGIQDEKQKLSSAEIPVSQDVEEGEYVNEEDSKVSNPSRNDDSCMRESLLFVGCDQNESEGGETPRNICDDLKVSDSDDGDEPPAEGQGCSQQQQGGSQEDDGLWF